MSSDLPAFLVAAASKLGAEHVRLVPQGRAKGRFRRHAHIIGEVAGQTFRMTVNLRGRDTPRRRRNSLAQLRAILRSLTGQSPTKPVRINMQLKKRRRQRVALGSPRQVVGVSPQAPTRLDRDPFSVLAALAKQMAPT